MEKRRQVPTALKSRSSGRVSELHGEGKKVQATPAIGGKEMGTAGLSTTDSILSARGEAGLLS